MAFSELAIRLAVAALCGAVIGFERESQQKPAGLRTHMLVAIGSAAFVLAALHVDELATVDGKSSSLQVDPSRVIQGIAGGIGFLGAGAIMRSNGSVQGVTTAATIWVVGAVGICSGLGNYTLAATTSVLVILITSLLGMIEGWLFSHKPSPFEDKSTKHDKSSSKGTGQNDDDQSPTQQNAGG